MSFTLGTPCAAISHVGADFDPMRDAQFSWVDTLKYFYYYLQNEFIDYALVVQISYFMAVLCAMSIILVLLLMMGTYLKRRRSVRYYRKIDKKYGQAVSQIVSAQHDLTAEEVHQIMGNRGNLTRKMWRHRQWAKMISEHFDAHRSSLSPDDTQGIDRAYSNLHRLLGLLGVEETIERMLREGVNADRIYLVQVAQQFHLQLSDAVVLRMANVGDVALGRVVQTYYMWCSPENPFRFLDEGGDQVYLQEDAIWLHQSLRVRSMEGKPMPTLLPYVLRAKTPALRALLIREVGYWGSEKDMPHIAEHFTDAHDDVRRASFEAVSRRKYLPAWQLMYDVYDQQSESLKRAILRSMFAMGDSRSVGFMERVCATTPSGQTLRLALRCLWGMGQKGRDAFMRVRQSDTDPSRAEVYEQIEVEAGEVPSLVPVTHASSMPPHLPGAASMG